MRSTLNCYTVQRKLCKLANHESKPLETKCWSFNTNYVNKFIHVLFKLRNIQFQFRLSMEFYLGKEKANGILCGIKRHTELTVCDTRDMILFKRSRTILNGIELILSLFAECYFIHVQAPTFKLSKLTMMNFKRNAFSSTELCGILADGIHFAWFLHWRNQN